MRDNKNVMFGEIATNSINNNQYKEFYTCENCHSVFEGEYKKTKSGIITIMERWWNPNTNSFEE